MRHGSLTESLSGGDCLPQNINPILQHLSPYWSQIITKVFQVIKFNQNILICKNEEDPSKNEGTRVVTTFLPL